MSNVDCPVLAVTPLDDLIEGASVADRGDALRDLERFVDLANRGRSRMSSSGASAARRLARAILKDVPALDGQAVAGLALFIDVAKYAPETARGSLR